jgi:hypothetical protein
MLGMSPAMDAALAFSTPYPVVRLTDLRTDTTDTNVYTFTACQIDLGGSLTSADDEILTNAHVRAASKRALVVAVHGEDAAATFNVSGVTLGGVSGTEHYDRGGAGAGVLVNTACYIFFPDTLGSITTTDIVVTFSENVTSCAIAVISIENIRKFDPNTSGADTTGTGDLTVATTATSYTIPGFPVYLAFSTINATGEAVSFVLNYGSGAGGSLPQPQLLYESDNGEMGYAGAWAWSYPAGSHAGASWTISWSGTADADAIAVPTLRV